ncbi:bacteriohemerythrin [Magnetospirillum sp. UT-4]|uniref:bacteriohemerythrin n=1 Tax=Magnetospirillum sp. UT-4 TaxID=2681467 RepID=UPI0013800224|nr:bacteriohemerythrin [Magnetospirillum sp. UT-4]CAA7623701.1 putative hemerythrin [Magnetospirillum sp. UT-4]
MAVITWSEMMSVGVPILDADHKTLVSLINNLHRSVGDREEYATLGSVLKALEDYAEHHFAREERVMEVCRYPSLEAHSRMHRNLAKQVRDLKSRYDLDRTAVRAKDCLTFLNKWLIEHICSTDMDYRAWVIGHPEALLAAETMSITGIRPNAGGFSWNRLSVLVVDDNENFRRVLQTILEGVGVTNIHLAANLDEARALLNAGGIGQVVTDWHVGVESGLDLVTWIRGRPDLARLPVLVLSGHERMAVRDQALAAGADEFMEKPISARGLLICLARLIREKGETP